jgi:adenine-specific DNA-methyltransferase
MEVSAVEHVDLKKLRGGYYTPEPITEFISNWAITKSTVRVLEPSCGDGSFIEAIVNRMLALGVTPNKFGSLLKGVELIPKEAEQAQQRLTKYGIAANAISNDDFFTFIEEADSNMSFDVVVGNPPFIRYQNFPEAHREKAFSMMVAMGLNPNKLTNIWVPFLVIAANTLTPEGRLGMVIPAELFQVKYAAETRIFLSNFFQRITIVTFKKLVFSDIQQEVVLLLCEKTVSEYPGVRVVELDTLADLTTLDLAIVNQEEVKFLEHNSEKWIKYFLEEHEIQLLRRLKQDVRINTVSDLMDVNVGIVTGRNDFFMLNAAAVQHWGLADYCIPVVGRSAHLKGLNFDQADFDANIDVNAESYLFLPPDVDFDKLPLVCQAYVRYGEELEYHTGYKCRIRKRWYITPSLWNPDLFALRQVGDYPKLIVNEVGASSTDTIHRVRLRADIPPSNIALSFLNSLSFAFSEILGRSYGGGVLTFEPSEVAEIPLPVLIEEIPDLQIEVDGLLRQRRITEVLDRVDQILLIEQLGLLPEEVRQLREIWVKLSNRRQNRR